MTLADRYGKTVNPPTDEPTGRTKAWLLTLRCESSDPRDDDPEDLFRRVYEHVDSTNDYGYAVRCTLVGAERAS